MHAAVHDNLVAVGSRKQAVGSREEVASCSMQFLWPFIKRQQTRHRLFLKRQAVLTNN